MQAGPLDAGWEAIKRDDLRAAEAIARGALERAPQDGEATYLLGSSLLFQDRFSEALAPLAAAARLAPRRGVGHRLGYCHLALGEFAQAEAVLRREVEAYPDLIDAWNALGVALINQARPQDALDVFLEAARRDPSSPVAHVNVANVLGDLGRGAEALPHLQQAVALDPKLADAHYNLGVLLHGLKRHEEAIASLEQAYRLAPETPYTLSHLLWNEIAVCRWDNLAPRIEALRAQVRSGSAAVEPFTFGAVCQSPEELRLCAERHVAEKIPARLAPLWGVTRYRHDRIRVAYLSSDYHEHATAYLAAGLFEQHDRVRFDVSAVSYGPDDGGPMRARLLRAFERFIDVRGRSDDDIAGLLRGLEVDIAVDLKGHTAGSRPAILARRPAPIQVAWLGFPGTMGAGFIDYILADRFVIPEDQQRFYSEKVVYLPASYQVNDAQRAIARSAPGRAEAGLPAAGFVFCCFNNNYKILPPVFSVWMRLLRDVPGSVLWLLEDNAVAKSNLQSAARARGIDPARLVFAPRLPPAEHLARHRLADLFLDTLPYNAHTTASDALWSGLPLVTCAGPAFGGRVAGSLLTALQMPELVASSLQEYEALALGLAREPGRLAQAREELARKRGSAPLFATGTFRQALEAAYVRMWQSWQRAEAPAGFSVAAQSRG